MRKEGEGEKDNWRERKRQWRRGSWRERKRKARGKVNKRAVKMFMIESRICIVESTIFRQ